MTWLRLSVSVVLMVAGLGLVGTRAVMTDAWNVGQYGAAIGGALLPGGLLCVVGFFLWPRKRR